MEFELAETSSLDTPDLVHINRAGWVNDDIWAPLILEAKESEDHDWQVAAFDQRNSLPDRKGFKITDRATGKPIAFAFLNYPYKLTAEQLAVANDEKPPPPGHNSVLAAAFFKLLDSTKNYGYNPETDFHRKGTMVHPDYQRKGLGSWLTRHCNAIADKAGAKTYVIARPSSKKMFESQRFRVLGEENLDMTEYGGKESDGKSWVLVRDPVEKVV